MIPKEPLFRPVVVMFSVVILSSLWTTCVTSWSLVSTPSCPVQERAIPLSTGVTMQVLSSQQPDHIMNMSNKPVLLFLHGSFHGAWCWTERWFPYFNEQGYPALIAISWRGTGGTLAGPKVRKVQIAQHVADLRAILEENLDTIVVSPPAVARDQDKDRSDARKPGRRDRLKPVVICHSFGGLAVMKYLEEKPERAHLLSGIVTMCSVPPSGNGQLTWRYLLRSWRDSWKITAGFALKKCLSDPQLCRDLFFGGSNDPGQDDMGISNSDLRRYQEYFRRDSEATIDLLDLAKQLPSLATDPQTGHAPFVANLPPCLVIGASDDFLVDQEGYQETANYFGLHDVLMVDSPHDVMLGRKWQNAAKAIDDWIRGHVMSSNTNN